MSVNQPNAGACTITVSRETADVLRLQTIRVLEFNHEDYEEILDFTPEGQRALVLRFQDAFNVLYALGFDPNADPHIESFDVPLTTSHIEQLVRRRQDLGMACIEHITFPGDLDADTRAAVTSDRLAAETLDQLILDYLHTTNI